MARSSTTIRVHNTSESDAWIIVQHKNKAHGLHNQVWHASAGKAAGEMTISFDADAGDGQWWIYLGVPGGKIYTSSGSVRPSWKTHALTKDDHDKSCKLEVSHKHFHLTTASGRVSHEMAATSANFLAAVTNVFVLMLENHSLDVMLGLSGIPGITPMTTANYNTYNNTQYDVSSPAPLSMTADPGHELPDVLMQLTGKAPGTWQPPLGPYPPLVSDFADGSYFAASYATADDEDLPPPAPGNIGDIMKCFTPAQLPVMNQLANEFAVCSNWFSSLPGPTWPNRFFLHCASSGGLDCSPTSSQIAEWETVDGFSPPKGSIFDLINNSPENISYGVYQDSTILGYSNFSDNQDASDGALGLGDITQVTALQGMYLWDNNYITDLPGDLGGDLTWSGDYPYAYTFIEPHYGNVVNETYQGGSSQHPMDDVAGGEGLLQFVYETIRNSPLWNTSLLIVTYDEHGGFYDSVAPGSAPMPEDGSPTYNPNGGGPNTTGFQFDQYGVRVPALVISPLIAKGAVDPTVYDHTSVLATIEQLWGLPSLTNRDGNATDLGSLISLSTPRTDCPAQLVSPASSMARITPAAKEKTNPDLVPMPESGNLIGALAVLRKADLELSAGIPEEKAKSDAMYHAIKTKGDLKKYAAHVQAKVKVARTAARKSKFRGRK